MPEELRSKQRAEHDAVEVRDRSQDHHLLRLGASFLSWFRVSVFLGRVRGQATVTPILVPVPPVGLVICTRS